MPEGERPAAGAALWRVFPWDRHARAGEPFSPRYLRHGQTSGRFDLHDRPLVRYLAESQVHAVAEKLQRYRGRTIAPAHLREWGHPLALVAVTVPDAILTDLADLTSPAALAALEIAPDRLASGSRAVTQAIARRVHEAGHTGLRWWSALDGDWHGVVLFTDRAPDRRLAFGDPELLTLEHAALRDAAMRLGVRVAARRRRG